MYRSTPQLTSRFRTIVTLAAAELVMALAGMAVLPEILHSGEPVQSESFRQAGIVEAWDRYGDRLTFGKGQTLALVDDGCKLSMPDPASRQSPTVPGNNPETPRQSAASCHRSTAEATESAAAPT